MAASRAAIAAIVNGAHVWAMARPANRETSTTFVAIIALVVLPFVWVIGPYALAIFTGIMLAVLSHPIYAWFLTKRWRPIWASLVVTIALIVLVMGPLAWFLWAALDQAVALVTRLAKEDIGLESMLSSFMRWGPVRRYGPDPAMLEEQIRLGAGVLAKEAGNVALAAASQVPSYLFQGAVCALTVYFMLIDGRRFYDWVTGKLPLPLQIRESLAASFRGAANAVVLSSMASTGSQAAVILAGYLSLGVPAAFLAAFAAFILAWIPMVGILPIWSAGMIWLYFQDEYVRAGIMLGVGLLASLVDNIVRPAVLAGREAMHPLTSLVSIFGGIAMFGMVGVFVGPVLAAMVKAVLDTWPAVARHCGVPIADNGELPEVDLPPPPESPEDASPPPVQ